MAYDIIEALGGPKALAEVLATSPNAVFNWRKRGIPWHQRHVIARIAAERGVPLPETFWQKRVA